MDRTRIIRRGTVVAALVVLVTIGLDPGRMSASTTSEAPPEACTFPVPTAITGSPVELSGLVSTAGGSVEIEADGPDKRVREATGTTADGAWHAVLVFGAADAGPWTLRVSIEGGPPCQGPMSVVLAQGAVAPPTPAEGEEGQQHEATSGDVAAGLRGLAVEAFAGLVLGSWIFLMVVGLAAMIGARPLSRPRVRMIAAPATFLAIVGGFLSVALLTDFMVSLSHFDSGTPPDQQAVLDKAIWAAAAIGTILGAIAAFRIGTARDAT
jgi:hypothetical protein